MKKITTHSGTNRVRPLLLFSLFLVARARSFFRKFQKKKKNGSGARHKVELSTRVLLCCPCSGEIVTVEGLAEERDSERTREKTHAFSRMSTSATQCAATLQGKRPLQKGTDVYQEQENF